MMISGAALKARGWDEGPSLGLAKKAGVVLMDGWAAQGLGLDEDVQVLQSRALDLLDAVKAAPAFYRGDAVLAPLVEALLALEARARRPVTPPLRPAPLPYHVWGAGGIDAAAHAQMDLALRLPISVAGALMPDAHVGYGLPIGGVLATVGAVIPYAVGSDIACRMRISVYEVEAAVFDDAVRKALLTRALQEQTAFGPGAAWRGRQRADHAVLDDPAWKATRLLSSLHGRAVDQLATSGSGNHFVEWGTLDLSADDLWSGLPPGRCLALLSHSGSRAVGFKIADAYTKLAEGAHPDLDRAARQMAWLDLDSAEGQEYMVSMHLAGRFAQANHELIHRRVAAAAGLREVATVENHHNFAWEEKIALPDGTEQSVIVHRKGATPAGPGVLGVIPGSMADPGFLVRGKGVPASLSSASHGAGRAMGRRAANESIAKADRDRYLRERDVSLLGGGMDEAPQAYKRIEDVIAAQTDLVDVLGVFRPRIVRMADEPDDV